MLEPEPFAFGGFAKIYRTIMRRSSKLVVVKTFYMVIKKIYTKRGFTVITTTRLS